MKRGALIALAGLVFGAALLVCYAPLPAALEPGRRALVIYDAAGGVLREPPMDDGLRAHWVPLSALPEAARDAIVQSEDHRLGSHPGVDPLGLVRAAWLDVKSGRVVAGGSTLAMQLARLTYGLPRTWLGKLAQLPLGVFLQARLGSEGVLEAYVNLAPLGRDVRGLAMGSWAYFGKPLRDLTTGEAVALACLVRAPTAYDPYRHPERLLARRRHVLGLMHARGVLSEAARREAEREPLHVVPFGRAFRAPHASELALSEVRGRAAQARPTRVHTTLDATLQQVAQRACRDAVARLSTHHATDCAAVVLRASTAEVLALVGSPDFASPHAGQVNAALSLRQPGSALKPFVYALAFERGRRPGDLIRDEPTHFPAAFGTWNPENYDGRFHGDVTLREALANSYNVPAAKLVMELGVQSVLERLRALGLTTLTEDAAHYGVGIALGDGEVRLYDLVAAYATLARGGEYLAPTILKQVFEGRHAVELAPRAQRRVFSPAVSYLVSHVLQDRAARRAAFGAGSVLDLPFDCAVKTGTSSNYRDNWTVGYAGDVVVGVWVGHHEGAPMRGVSGVSGAGPAFRRIMLAAAGKDAKAFPPPPSGVAFQQVDGRVDLAVDPGLAGR